MDPKDWKWRNSVEKKLYGRINKITGILDKILETHLTIPAIVDALEEVADTDYWKALSFTSAFDMVRTLSIQNAKTWREAARESQNSHRIFLALRKEFKDNVAFQTLVRNNAHYIRSVPGDVAKHITEHVASEAIRGTRAESLLLAVRKAAPDISKSRAQLIARTETAKSQAAIVEVRATQIGVNWYQWDTVHDKRVRSAHRHMQGVYCNFLSPPSPEALAGAQSVGYYNPGGIWNCRCSAYPVVDLDMLSFPIKVVQNGRIVKMGKRDFLALQ